MTEDGQFSWLDDDDTSAHNYIQKDTVKKREGQKNDATKHLRNKAQNNEFTKINKHGEGRCWWCGDVDKIVSSIYNSCEDCMSRKGCESIMTIMGVKKNHELCDFCGKWKIGVASINTSLDQKCINRVLKVHKLYRKQGGRMNAPIVKLAKKKFGKDYRQILGEGFLPPGA